MKYGCFSRAMWVLESQKPIRSQEIHHGFKNFYDIIFLILIMESYCLWAQTDHRERKKGNVDVLNRLLVDKSRGFIGYENLPIRQGTFSGKKKFAIKCNSSF